MSISLTLYRRHSMQQTGSSASLCSHRREQDDRFFAAVIQKTPHGILKVHQPGKKTEHRQDCNCPIVADGSLPKDLGRIRYRSLDTRSWEEAIRQATLKLQWEAWDEPDKPTPLPEAAFEQISVQQAVTFFLNSIGEGGQNLSRSNCTLYRVLLANRLLPFCAAHQPPIRFTASLSNAILSEQFTQSWRLLPKYEGDPKAGRALSLGGRMTYFQRWQCFLTYCFDKGWIGNVPKGGAPPSSGADKKPSLKPDEMARIREQANCWPLKRSAELQLAFLLFERTGMRISDVATLADTDIVWFAPGNCHAIDKIEWKLRKKSVRLWHPLDSDVHEALMAHGFRGGKDGSRYFFWTCKGKATSCIGNLTKDFVTIFRKAQDPDPATGKLQKPFSVPVTCHTLRHTYGQRLYDSGKYPIDVIAELMGHRHVATTMKFYVGKTEERKATLARAVQSQNTDRLKNLKNVVPIKQRA